MQQHDWSRKGGNTMSLIKRISRIVSANLNSIIEKAEDPELMLRQLIREMDENIIDMRTEVAKALAAEKRAARRIDDVRRRAATWQENSERAVRDGKEELARKAIERRLQEEARLPDLVDQHVRAAETGKKLQESLRVLEDKIQEARRRQELLVARRRSAEAHQAALAATQGFATAVRKSDQLLARSGYELPDYLSALEDDVLRAETEAEALQDLAAPEPSLEEVFSKAKTADTVERELQLLKEKVAKG
jgi:phage shock protein A